MLIIGDILVYFTWGRPSFLLSSVNGKRFVLMGFAGTTCMLALILVIFTILPGNWIHMSEAFTTPTTQPPNIDMANRANTKMTVHDAIQLAITRNLSLGSQALTIAQKQNAKWATYSDMIAQLNVEYKPVVNRYWQPGSIGYLAGKHASRWMIRGSTAVGNTQSVGITLQPEYPYRIDPYKAMTLTATLTHPIYSGGRLSNSYQYSVMDAIASGVDMETMRRDLTNSVIQAFYHVVLNKKLLEVADESIREFAAFKKRANALQKHGEALKVDVAAAEGNLAKAKARKSKVVADLETALAQLNFLLVFPQGTHFKVDDRVAYKPSPYSIPEIYLIAVSNRTEVKKANISVDQAISQVKIAQAAFLPGVNLQLQGQRMNDDWNVFDPEGTNEWSIQGILTLSFDTFRTRETVHQKRNAHSQSVVNKEYLVQQIMQQVHAAYLQVKQSEANIEEFRTEIKWRKDQYDRTRAMYNQQLSTYLNVMDAIANLDLSKSNYFTAVLNHTINVAELERQMGTLR